MKIVIFNDDKEVLDVTEGIEDPEPYSTSEIRWKDGGANYIQHNYVIIEDNQQLEDLTEEEIEAQLKLQTKIELARRYEENRIVAMALGEEEKEEAAFKAARDKVDKAKGKEKITVEALGYKNRGALISELNQNKNEEDNKSENTAQDNE